MSAPATLTPSLDEAVALYTAGLAARRGSGNNTVVAYRADLALLLGLLRADGVTRWEELTRPVLRRLPARLQELGYARASIARMVAALRGLGRYLARLWGRWRSRRRPAAPQGYEAAADGPDRARGGGAGRGAAWRYTVGAA